MDFDQLHTFLEIVRLKSFSKAAQTCYRTQPAISAQVRQLEQELRADLFERFGSRISLTTAGKIFAEYAEQMLDLRRRAQDVIAELETNPRGELVIAGNEATCIYVLPKVFSEYRRQFQSVQLQVLRSYGSRVVEAVMENSADFGLVQLPVEEKRLQVVNIYRDEIRLIVPAGHPLADRTSVTAQDVTELLPGAAQVRQDAHAPERVAGSGGRRHPHRHGTGFHGDDEALRDRGSGRELRGGFQLPRRDRGRQTAGDPAGAGTDGAPFGTDLPQGQGAIQGGAGIHPDCAG